MEYTLVFRSFLPWYLTYAHRPRPELSTPRLSMRWVASFMLHIDTLPCSHCLLSFFSLILYAECTSRDSNHALHRSLGLLLALTLFQSVLSSWIMAMSAWEFTMSAWSICIYALSSVPFVLGKVFSCTAMILTWSGAFSIILSPWCFVGSHSASPCILSWFPPWRS